VRLTGCKPEVERARTYYEGGSLQDRRHLEKLVATFQVILAESGATISTHKNKAEARAAIRRYEAADARRASDFYPGDIS
jgi:hypothetical protein